MRIITCIMTENDCYKTAGKITPIGVVVHSTGANNPNLKRYIQPTHTNAFYDDLIRKIGVNKNHNDWNRAGVDKCVHAMIGRLEDGTISTIQTLPSFIRGWHVGKGKYGSYNNSHLSFEICEDNLKDKDYFDKVMKEAQELCAMWCEIYEWNPLEEGRVISHHEAHMKGYASNHGDIDAWLKIYGLDMNWFRQEVKKIMDAKENEPSEWAKEAVAYWKDKGVTDGTRLKAACTREEVLTMLYRIEQLRKDGKL